MTIMVKYDNKIFFQMIVYSPKHIFAMTITDLINHLCLFILLVECFFM